MDVLPWDCIEYIYKTLHKMYLTEIHKELVPFVNERRKCIIYSSLSNLKQNLYTESEFIKHCREEFPGPPLNYLRDFDDEIDFDLLGYNENSWEYKYIMDKLDYFESLEDSIPLNVVDWLVFTGAIKFNENEEEVHE